MSKEVDRILATVVALLIFTLHEMHLYRDRPRTADVAAGFSHIVNLRLFGGDAQVYATLSDVALRYGLAAGVTALCFWAVAETFVRKAPKQGA